MCPSFRATRDEVHTTRARANALREFIVSKEDSSLNENDVKRVLDLCLSCKACKTECPSSVDVAALKSEFEQYYNDKHSVNFRTKAFAYNNKLNKSLVSISGIYNSLVESNMFSNLIKAL